jgi:CheY-like chemotaxis protein
LSVAPPLRILVVEDEILIALELESLLQDIGHEVVGLASSSVEAIALGQDLRPNLAFVDIHLADGPTGVDVARRLTALGVTVLFMTANAKRIPEDAAGAQGVISKPYTERGVRQALAYVMAQEPAPAGADNLTFVPFRRRRDERSSPRA